MLPKYSAALEAPLATVEPWGRQALEAVAEVVAEAEAEAALLRPL